MRARTAGAKSVHRTCSAACLLAFHVFDRAQETFSDFAKQMSIYFKDVLTTMSRDLGPTSDCGMLENAGLLSETLIGKI